MSRPTFFVAATPAAQPKQYPRFVDGSFNLPITTMEERRTALICVLNILKEFDSYQESYFNRRVNPTLAYLQKTISSDFLNAYEKSEEATVFGWLASYKKQSPVLVELVRYFQDPANKAIDFKEMDKLVGVLAPFNCFYPADKIVEAMRIAVPESYQRSNSFGTKAGVAASESAWAKIFRGENPSLDASVLCGMVDNARLGFDPNKARSVFHALSYVSNCVRANVEIDLNRVSQMSGVPVPTVPVASL